MNLKSHLFSLLDSREMTASALSRKSGVPKQTISDWLAGRKPRDITQVKKVATVFGLSIDELCYGTKPQAQAARLQPNDTGADWISGVFEVRIRRVK